MRGMKMRGLSFLKTLCLLEMLNKFYVKGGEKR
jgi:hypothetical protein